MAKQRIHTLLFPIGFTGLLAATAMGVYVLIIAGATTAITDAAAACSTWPACNGRWLVPIEDTRLLIAWGHRVVALLVGILVGITAAASWHLRRERRVRLALTLAALLFPVEIGLGALSATTETPPFLSAVHLLVGMSIFAGLVGGLAWTLEAETGASQPRRHSARADREREEPASPEERRATPSARREGRWSRPKLLAFSYFQLMKPRLMWLLCLVASAGMALAAGPALDVRTVLATLGGGVLAIGASGTFNHVLERDIDREMSRTADRPVVTELIPVRNAVLFGLALTVSSLAVFLSINLLAAALGLAAILFYSVIYTLVLKPNTVQNTVIGGFAGALPALIGAAAATGRIGGAALVLAAVIFLWTPAHFYNLALAYKEDYARGGFPMLPVVRGETVTRKHILYYLGATLLGASLLSGVAGLGPLFAATSTLLGAVFLWAVVKLHYERTERAAFRAFHASNAYLGALLLAVVVDALAL